MREYHSAEQVPMPRNGVPPVAISCAVFQYPCGYVTVNRRFLVSIQNSSRPEQCNAPPPHSGATLHWAIGLADPICRTYSSAEPGFGSNTMYLRSLNLTKI